METETQDKAKQLSETKKLILRKMLEAKNIGSDRLLSLEGSNMKVLREGSPIVFVFPATDGSVAYMRAYLPHIPSHFGVYGCQTPGLEGEPISIRTVEEIAAHNVREIRRIQPKGPYYLSGICMGGLPAYEAARQLSAAGEKVALVLHVMPGFTRDWNEMPGRTAIEKRAFVDFLFIIERSLGVKLDLPIDRMQELNVDGQIAYVLNQIHERNLLSGVDLEAVQKRMVTYRANLEAMLNYSPKDWPDGKMFVVAVGEKHLGEMVMPMESPYAAVLRAIPPSQYHVAYVDADGGAVFDGAEPAMSKIGVEVKRVFASI